MDLKARPLRKDDWMHVSQCGNHGTAQMIMEVKDIKNSAVGCHEVKSGVWSRCVGC